ncbi:hypothetical protein [Streptomyces sp. NPDC058989]|uniref:hypothetical protein n=1 Tax=Streptomyces sp. NPDC058989 TaxID=3346686 RepID=UPI0036A7CE05
MDGPIYSACTLLAVMGTTLWMCHAYLRRHSTRRRLALQARIAAFATCGFASLLTIPAVADTTDSITGAQGTARLVANLAAAASMASMQVMLMDWTREPSQVASSVTSRLAIASTTAVALVVQFLLIDTTKVAVTTAYAADGHVTGYLLTYLAFVAFAGLEITFLATRLALSARRLRRPAAAGLMFLSIGCTSSVTYTLHQGGYLVAYQFGHSWPLAVEQTISSLLIGLAISCNAIGIGLGAPAFRQPAKVFQRSASNPAAISAADSPH